MNAHLARKPRSVGSVIQDWRPEDAAFWAQTGNRIANRNLAISVPALLLAFAIWQMFSAVAISLPLVGFQFDTNQLFWLAALPALSGATLRIFYSFVVPLFGGRRWTAIATASLLIPAVWLGIAVQDTSTPYWHFVAIAMLCGFGGGNFSSSMSNISFFYPKAKQGFALGMNAGLGNLGVSATQFVIPLVITLGLFGGIVGGPQLTAEGKQLFLQNAGFVWVPFLVVCAIAAWFGMHDLAAARSSFAEQAVIFKRKHNWLMCVLYLGTFGSFIGFAAGFPLLIKSQFPDVNPLAYAWLGPLVGAVIRPFGGWLSDKVGGGVVTFWNFIVMALAVLGVLYFLPKGAGGYALPFGPQEGSFGGFFVMFLMLFLTTGIGNGSTFRMIPVIFLTQKLNELRGNDDAAKAQAIKDGNTEGAAAVGFAGALGAYGGFFIPKSYGSSIAATGGPEFALWMFAAFYTLCIVITWWYYARKNAEMPC